jgi:hypothetical protein
MFGGGYLGTILIEQLSTLISARGIMSRVRIPIPTGRPFIRSYHDGNLRGHRIAVRSRKDVRACSRPLPRPFQQYPWPTKGQTFISLTLYLNRALRCTNSSPNAGHDQDRISVRAIAPPCHWLADRHLILSGYIICRI